MQYNLKCPYTDKPQDRIYDCIVLQLAVQKLIQ